MLPAVFLASMLLVTPGVGAQVDGAVQPPGRYGRLRVGLMAGATLSALVVPASLTRRTSTCTGSGDYLKLCRAIFVGSVAVGAGLGALVGGVMKSD
jgi:hypothetical protein